MIQMSDPRAVLGSKFHSTIEIRIEKHGFRNTSINRTAAVTVPFHGVHIVRVVHDSPASTDVQTHQSLLTSSPRWLLRVYHTTEPVSAS